MVFVNRWPLWQRRRPLLVVKRGKYTSSSLAVAPSADRRREPTAASDHTGARAQPALVPLVSFAPGEHHELLDQTRAATLAIGDDEPLLRAFPTLPAFFAPQIDVIYADQ